MSGTDGSPSCHPAPGDLAGAANKGLNLNESEKSVALGWEFGGVPRMIQFSMNERGHE